MRAEDVQPDVDPRPEEVKDIEEARKRYAAQKNAIRNIADSVAARLQSEAMQQSVRKDAK